MNSFICFFSMRFWSSRASFWESLAAGLAATGGRRGRVHDILVHFEIVLWGGDATGGVCGRVGGWLMGLEMEMGGCRWTGGR
jgi:hypothetical protein